MHLTLFFILVDIIQRGRQKLIMETLFLIGATIVFISGLEFASWYVGLSFIPGNNLGWVDVGKWIPLELPPRLAWAMNSPNWLSAFVAPLITVTIGWALTARFKEHRRVLWILAGLLTLVLILTFTRGGIMSLLAGLGMFTVMRLTQIPDIRQRISPQVLIGGVAVAGVVGVALVMIVTLSGVSGRSSGDRVRVDMYTSAAEMTVDYPILGNRPRFVWTCFS